MTTNENFYDKEDLTTLIELGLTGQQALETLILSKSMEDALTIVRGFRQHDNPSGVYIGSYDEFLESIRTAKYGSHEIKSLYEQELEERNSMVPEEARYSQKYRDRPVDSQHYWEDETEKQLENSEEIPSDQRLVNYLLRKEKE